MEEGRRWLARSKIRRLRVLKVRSLSRARNMAVIAVGVVRDDGGEGVDANGGDSSDVGVDVMETVGTVFVKRPENAPNMPKAVFGRANVAKSLSRKSNSVYRWYLV